MNTVLLSQTDMYESTGEEEEEEINVCIEPLNDSSSSLTKKKKYPLYSFVEHREYVKEALLQFIEENELPYLLNQAYLDTHLNSILKQLDNYHARGIDVLIADEFLDLCYCLNTETLVEIIDRLFSSSIDDDRKGKYYGLRAVEQKEADKLPPDHVQSIVNKKEYTSLVKKKKKKSLFLWSVYEITDSESVLPKLINSYITTPDRVFPLKTMKNEIEIFQNYIKTIESTSNSFIECEKLELTQELKKRRTELIKSLKTLFCSQNLFLVLNPGSYNLLYEHFLLSKKITLTELLEKVISVPGAKSTSSCCSSSSTSSFTKRTINFSIKEYMRLDPDLLKQIKGNQKVFVNWHELANVVNGKTRLDDGREQAIICIGITQYSVKDATNPTIYMYYIPESGYREKRESNALMRKLLVSVGTENSDNTREPHEYQHEKLKNSARNTVPIFIKKILDPIFPGNTVWDLPQDKIAFFIKKVMDIYDHQSGFTSALESLLIYLKESAIEAKKNGEEMGWMNLKGQLVMTLEKIRSEDFKCSNEHQWSDRVKTLMSDKKNVQMVKTYMAKQLANVDTLSFTIGDQTLSTSVFPCVVPEQYYQINYNIDNSVRNITNNQQIINHNNTIVYDNEKTKQYIDSIEELIEEITNEPDPLKRMILKDKIRQIKESSRKRKRIINEDSDDSSSSSSRMNKVSLVCKEIKDPDLFEQNRCEQCTKMKTLKHFFTKREKKRNSIDEPILGQIRNICHSCVSRNSRDNQSTKKKKIYHK